MCFCVGAFKKWKIEFALICFVTVCIPLGITTLAFFIGFSAGVLAYFISPLFVVAIALVIFFAYFVFRTPQVGIILVILTLPLVDPIITKISLVYIFVAYAVKVILRKRVF